MTEEKLRTIKPHARLDPPFCRKRELEDIVSAIRSEGSQAVFITSESGLGASTILRELTSVAEEHVAVLNIRGSQSLVKVPYGVLAPFLSAAGIGGASLRIAVLSEVLAELARMREEMGRNGNIGNDKTRGSASDADPDTISASTAPYQDLPLIVIDDAHMMDQASGELIVSLVRAGMVKLVASHSNRHALPEPFPKLWADGMAENIILRPLNQEQAHNFCEGLLGGRVSPATGWFFWSSAGGNPLFLRLLVARALEHGGLTRRRAVWVVDPNTPIHSTDLEDAVRLEIRGISRKASEALSLIALSEPVDSSSVEALIDGAAVQELLDWSLVRFVRPHSKLLGLTNPIIGDIVREMVPISQSRQLHERLIRVLEGAPVDKEALLRRVVWSLDVGVELPDDQVLAAAVLASKLFHSQTALELANRVRDPDFRLRANMVRARAYYNLGDYQSALRQMDLAVKKVRSIEELLFGSLLRANARSALGMSVELLKSDASALRKRGAQLAQKNAAEADTIMSRSESGALLIELMVFSREGRYSEMTEPMAWLSAANDISSDSTRLNRTMVLTMESERLSAQGCPEQGMARAAEAYAIAHSDEDDVFFLPESILLRHLAAAMCGGDWQAATKVLEEFSLDAGPVVFSFGGGANVVRGMAFLRGGRDADALQILLAGVDSLQVSDPQQLLGFCTAMAAYAAARVGNDALAQQLLDSHREGHCIFLVGAHERAYVAAAKHLLMHDGGSPAELLALADVALANRSTTLELNALALILELGDLSVVPRVARVAAEVEGQWARALSIYATALEKNDGQELAAAGEVLTEAGLLGMAKQALEKSIKQLEKTDSKTQARKVSSNLRRVSEELKDNTRGSIELTTNTDPLSRAEPDLTRREREIATMAALGRSDRGIAEELVLSLRTVEGHLYRAYAKLGISGRDELPDLRE